MKDYKFYLAGLGFYAVIILLKFIGVLGDFPMIIINMSLIYVILTTSLNLINGFAGQFSIGHMGFAGVGAYVSGTLTTLIWKLTIHTPLTIQIPLFVVALIAGGIAAAIVGFLISIPSFRLRGDYLAITTLGFGEIIRVVINNIDYVGGPRGLLGIPRLSNFTLVFAFTFLTIAILRNIIYSHHGRALLSIREDYLASAMMGVNTTKYKMYAFTIGAFFAGIGGGLLCHLIKIAHPTQYGFMGSILLLVILYVGGMGSMTGSIIAAFLLTIVERYLLPVLFSTLSNITNPLWGFSIGQEWKMVLYAIILILIIMFRSEGIYGGKEAKIFIPEEEK